MEGHYAGSTASQSSVVLHLNLQTIVWNLQSHLGMEMVRPIVSGLDCRVLHQRAHTSPEYLPADSPLTILNGISCTVQSNDCNFSQPWPDAVSRQPIYLLLWPGFGQIVGARSQSKSFCTSIGVSMRSLCEIITDMVTCNPSFLCASSNVPSILIL